MGTLEIQIPFNYALLWFSVMVVCSSLAIMTSAFLYQHDKRNPKIKDMLGLLTNSALLFFISGILAIITSVLQITSTSAEKITKLVIETGVPALIFLAIITFSIASVQIYGGLSKLNEIYEVKEEENPAYLNKLWRKIKVRWRNWRDEKPV